MMHPGPAIKLASLLMVHTLTIVQPTYKYRFVLTGPPAQYNRLMVALSVTGPWTQLNLPDGSCGQRSGTNYVIPAQNWSPTLFFTLKPCP